MEFENLKKELESVKDYLKYSDYQQIKKLILKNENMINKDKKIYNKEAEELKQKGNEEFYKNNYETALDYYTQAISIQPEAVYYSNRACVYVKLNQIENAISDCEMAIEMDQFFVKPYLRLGLIYLKINKNKSKEYFERVLEIEPENEFSKEELKKLNENNINPNDAINELLNNEELVNYAKDILGSKSQDELNEMLKSILKKK